LIGLPPTPEELHAFLTDNSSLAYEHVVDRLLASPRYGERWGRHFMDIWRYSDWAGWSDGGQIRDSQPFIWRWRDWIVEALNNDKPYDRMIVEMLAGDEVAPEDPQTLRATGYLVRNYKMLSREKWLQDTVDHTAMAFLGVTLGCARCHDHMYDPILQKEYYQVRAIFEPHQVRIDRLPGQPDTKKDGLVQVYDANPQVPTYLFIRGDDRAPDKTPLAPGVPEALGGRFPTIEPVALPKGAYAPDKREFVVRETVAASAAAIVRARQAVTPATRQALAAAASLPDRFGWQTVVRAAPALTAFRQLELTLATVQLAELQHDALLAVLRTEKLEEQGGMANAEWESAARTAALLQRHAAVLQTRFNLLTAQQALLLAPAKARAEPLRKVAEATAALVKADAEVKLPPSTAYSRRPVVSYPSASTGRRLAFARWIASRDNPLTARVAMNHLWLRHFGQAIVPSVFDFGRNGRPPSHPALLDWLAAEFMDHGWSLKAMHRLLVTSATYRMASTTDPGNVALDRDNIYLWRMPSRRVEAEVVRDCIFYVAGKLDLTMGGPEIDEHTGLTVPRRSLYFRHAAEKQMEFLKLFDCAAVTECYQRKDSVMPQQALALANSELTLKHARLLARELAARTGNDGTTFVTLAFERVLARPPTSAEMAECTAYLDQQRGHFLNGITKGVRPALKDGQPPSIEAALRARESLVHVLLNHNDFVTVR
jgi:hypothetical protein